MRNKNFLIIGSGGYIAPRHINAIKHFEGNIVGCVDIFFSEDSLKLLPENTTKCSDINEFIESTNSLPDFMVVCSPNFLHQEQISKGLELNMKVIAEKPVALDMAGIKDLSVKESKSDGEVFTILQLRLHPIIKKLKESISLDSHRRQVSLKYVAKRDVSYFDSWKGDFSLSGGLVLNVGVHYIDMMQNLFGKCQDIHVEVNNQKKSKGTLGFEQATVDWLFSFEDIDTKKYLKEDQSAFRSISINDQEVVFSSVSEDLHTLSYEKILSGKGFGLEEASKSIEIIDQINTLGSQ